MNERLDFLNKKANNLPELPGVYLMKNSSGKIIYIGKAKKLKSRVSSYFRNSSDMQIKVIKMVNNVYDFDYIICDSEYEALCLECSQIKLHTPKYNILLKDDKGYSYLRISNSTWPSLSVVFQKENDGATYIGPYYSNYVIKSALEEAIKIFKIPDCKKNFPKDLNKSRPCLNYHIGRCMAPCGRHISHEEYMAAINGALSFIKGGKNEAVKILKNKMEKASENLQFEIAAKYRDQIAALNKSNEKQKVVFSKNKEQDIIAVSYLNGTFCFAVFNYKNHNLSDYNHYTVNSEEDIAEARKSFLIQYYQDKSKSDIPSFILLDGEINDKELLQEFILNQKGKNVKILIPQKGTQNELIKMASINASENLAKYKGKENKNAASLTELAKLLGLKNSPAIIEAYDISHLGGENAVAGMTVFKNGVPAKYAYKRFLIKSGADGDDYASLREVLTRRFNEYEKENFAESENINKNLKKSLNLIIKENQTEIKEKAKAKENAKENTKENTTAETASKVTEANDRKTEKLGFKTLPDLILIDGGTGQLSAVESICRKYNVPVFGMVKNGKHKTRAIAAKGSVIEFKANKSAYELIFKIQEETHRFAISYQRSLRLKKGITSELTKIEGIGPKRANSLIKAFKTIENIKKANIEELAKVLPKKEAENIYNFFN